ncbi:MAG: hypothetical protein LBB80_06320 [Treponema sp.]|jgi:hypothetical protein|nr:hypothetical protein [Treponema sp.]
MADLMKEADKLGILNIDIRGDKISPKLIQIAIEATKQLDSPLDKEIITQKLQKTDSVFAAQYR